MTDQEVERRLKEMGLWKGKLTLEPFDLLTDFAPTGRLDKLATYRLVDDSLRPQRDRVSRNWQPVVVCEDKLLHSPSPEMFAHMLACIDYFQSPKDFDQLLIFQLHRLALDHYQGYQVREDELALDMDRLTIHGWAYRGAGHNIQNLTFETRVTTDYSARFSVSDLEDQLTL